MKRAVDSKKAAEAEVVDAEKKYAKERKAVVARFESQLRELAGERDALAMQVRLAHSLPRRQRSSPALSTPPSP
jgi:hypothetical protein